MTADTRMTDPQLRAAIAGTPPHTTDWNALVILACHRPEYPCAWLLEINQQVIAGRTITYGG
jgi:hypothetical protein